MRIVAAILCGALLIAGSGCRTKPSEEEAADLRVAQLRTALLARLIPPQQQLFTTLEPSSYRPSLSGVVVADVFAYREALGPGAALHGDPLDYLANLRGPGPAARWLAAPAAKRVFTAGAGSDGPTIATYAEMLGAAGYEVFYHDYCQNLQPGSGACATETVGAYFATAGHLLLGTSEASVRSGLVREESTGAPPFTANARRAVLITPVHAGTIGETTATDFAAVEIATRPPLPER